MSEQAVHHPVFARVFDRLSRLMEREAGEHRDELLAGLSGRVVEIGAGNGMNFGHYPTTVAEVVALEPEPYLHAQAERAARTARVQERLDRSGIWPRVGGGCHCARDTVEAIKIAGFGVERVRSYALGPDWIPTNPHVLGSARADAR